MQRLREFLVVLLAIFICSAAGAQDSLSHTKFDVRSERLSQNKYRLIFQARIPSGWWLYAPNQQDFGATIEFPDSSFRLIDSFGVSRAPIVRASKVLDSAIEAVYADSVTWTRDVEMNTVPATLQGTLSFSEVNNEFQAPGINFSVPLEGGERADTIIKVASIDIDHPLIAQGDKEVSDNSLWVIFGLGFLGGLVALITPCVFPLIPLTVSFFTKRSGSRKKGLRNAFLYGFSIFLIYFLLSLPFHLTQKADPQIFNNLSTNVTLNIVFFVVFIVFALSFFGLYEIGLPSSFANKVDSKAGLGDVMGIFFMALTLAIVSFSCTGPILGTLLAGTITNTGGAMQLTAGMSGFGLGLALPFALFAMFPGLLQNLPKSGGWLDEVKVVLGYIELAMAIKFLSNADLVKRWGILKRETFIGLWVIIGILIVLYLLGVTGSKSRKIKFRGLRLFFIAVFSAITIYLAPGILNSTMARLSLISGFPPGFNYSIYGKHNVNLASTVEPIFNDYQAALKKAGAEHKPVLIDFTGWACTNCRRMEDQVWTNDEVASLMENSLVVVSLYVDDRVKLPVRNQFVYHKPNGEEKPIITAGDKWTEFEIANFHAATQPLYALLTPDQVALTYTKAYTPDPEKFAAWLRAGINAYKARQK